MNVFVVYKKLVKDISINILSLISSENKIFTLFQTLIEQVESFLIDSEKISNAEKMVIADDFRLYGLQVTFRMFPYTLCRF